MVRDKLQYKIMVSKSKYIIFTFLLASILSIAHGQGFNWENALPEDMGFSSEKLNAMRDTLAIHKTSSILVIRNDKIVLEWYAPGWNLSKQHGTASLAKALVGGMSLVLGSERRENAG